MKLCYRFELELHGSLCLDNKVKFKLISHGCTYTTNDIELLLTAIQAEVQKLDTM